MQPASTDMRNGYEIEYCALRALAAFGKEADVAAGQLLIERGLHGSGLYLILAGTVIVEAGDTSRRLGPGSYVGYRALFTPNGRRTARVRAETDVRVLAVARADFERLYSAAGTSPARHIAERER